MTLSYDDAIAVESALTVIRSLRRKIGTAHCGTVLDAATGESAAYLEMLARRIWEAVYHDDDPPAPTTDDEVPF